MVYFGQCIIKVDLKRTFHSKHHSSVLAYKRQYCIRHRLEAYVTLGIHSLTGKKSSVVFSQFPTAVIEAINGYQLAQASYGTVYACCYDGSNAFTVLFFCAVGKSNFSTTDCCTVELSVSSEAYTVLFEISNRRKRSNYSMARCKHC